MDRGARKTPLPNCGSPSAAHCNAHALPLPDPVPKGEIEMQVVIVEGSSIDQQKGKADYEMRGSLVAGDEINIFELKNIGFIAQYFSVGLILAGLPATVYGVFLGYLNVPAYVYATAGVITTLPWSFKFLFGCEF